MIISKLEGGLGNQMFQYAMGRLLALQNSTELKLDHSYFLHLTGDPKITKYRYALGVFPNIRAPKANWWDVKLLFPIWHPLLAFRWEQLYQKLHLGSFRFLHETKGLEFHKDAVRTKGNVYVTGFWQHYRYPAMIERVLRQDFVFAEPVRTKVQKLLQKVPHARSVGVHVRRGDYLGIGLGVCSLEYYQRAAAVIKKKVKDPYFVVVSNDIAWAKKHLDFLAPALFIDPKEGSEAIDLCILSECAHNIIANSSFSWWGAWLNRNPKKLVIAPKPWFDWPDFKGKTPTPPDWLLQQK